MKKAHIASVAFIAIVMLAAMFALSQKTEAPDNNTNSTPNSSDTEQSTPETKATGSYVDYSEAELAESSGKKVLFFHAPWCPQCRSIEQGILEQGVPKGYTILKVDYDSSTELKQKYGVTLQTTFVKLDDDNNAVDKYVAYDEPTFDAVKRKFL